MNERVMQFRVGVMVLATLLIAGILVLLFNEPRDVISAVLPSLVPGGKYTVKIRFDEAPNVDTHTPVRKSGIRIGRVSEIDLLDDGGVLVTAKIDGNRRLRHNEIFRTRSDLLGDAVLEVVRSRDPNAPDDFIADGEQLAGVTVPGPAQVIENLEKSLGEVIVSVTKAGSALEAASADLGAAARDVSGLLGDNREAIDRAIEQANHTLEVVAKTAENFDKLIGDEQTQQKFRTAIDAFPGTLDQMKRTMASAEMRLNEMQGFTHILGSQDMIDRIDRGTKNLDAVMEDLATFSQRLNDPNGSLGLLLHDRQLYDHLNRAVSNVDELTRSFKPIVSDIRVFTDKIARHPEKLGVRGAIERSPGIK